MRRGAFALLALALLAGGTPPVEAQGCRTDRLGNTLCRDLPRQSPPPLRLGRGAAVPREIPPEDVAIPGRREDAFGETRPPRLSVTGERPFGARPRPEARTRICVRDAYGSVRCR
jgi:hypothetical protein